MNPSIAVTYAAVVCLTAAAGWAAYGGPPAGIAVGGLGGTTLFGARAYLTRLNLGGESRAA
jgi:hypothetical protein